ncbi:hypothetical protein EYR38_010695 [Pleurotus pulmonarius]|nr:hypothetical protein EYR38_010695 [Pleurotus pulmonarius]
MPYPQAVMSSPNAHFHDGSPVALGSPTQRRPGSRQRFVADLSQCLFDFVIQLLPTQEELAVKEDVRKLLERLIRTIEPESRLLSFGSTANGFSLRNSDMDLCCLIDSEERLAASDLVTMLGDLLERETKFYVKSLPHARIPIVKLSLDPSPGLPLGIACDIGFENRLALENTRLLMCYAMIDPARVRTMVLFLKVWSKRRKINSPYKGTLSSYGYVLLVIYFLVHVKNPPVLPNLQQMPPLRPISEEDTHLNGHNIWFFDDIELLRQRWHSDNNESVADLLIDFFRYYSRDFPYNTGVASIRAGLLKKDSKGWQNDLSNQRYNDARERNRLCIEDPFETDFNVGRCVTKDGLYTIRGEFMRASRILASRPERAIVALAELCEERADDHLISPPVPPRAPPPQTPYTVGSSSMRPKGVQADKLSPPMQFFESGSRPRGAIHVPSRSPPEHMAPKRSKWTSPPPAEASSDIHTSFESQLGRGIELATAASVARERLLGDAASSSSNSDIGIDEEPEAPESDDVQSVRSYTEGTSPQFQTVQRRPSWHVNDSPDYIPRYSSRRLPRQFPDQRIDTHIPSQNASPELHGLSAKAELARRSISGAPRLLRSNWSSPINTPPLSPDSPSSPRLRFTEPSTVYYQTTVTRSPRPTVLYPNSGSHPSFLSQYQQNQSYVHSSNHHPPQDIFSMDHPPLLSRTSSRGGQGETAGWSSGGPDTPTPTNIIHSAAPLSQLSRHSHSHSNATIIAPTPPPISSTPLTSHSTNSCTPPPSQTRSRSRSRSRSPPMLLTPPSALPIIPPPAGGFTADNEANACSIPLLLHGGADSPTSSSAGYDTSLSQSPSPSPSPSPPPATARPICADNCVSKCGSSPTPAEPVITLPLLGSHLQATTDEALGEQI